MRRQKAAEKCINTYNGQNKKKVSGHTTIITSWSSLILSSGSRFILPLHPGQVLLLHHYQVIIFILVRFYYCIIIRTLSASWSGFITASLSGPILPLHPGQVLLLHHYQDIICILVKYNYCIIIRSLSASWSIRYRRSLVKSSTRITNLVKSYITTAFWSGPYNFILSSPILPLYLGQVIPHHPFQIQYYRCKLVKSFHLILSSPILPLYSNQVLYYHCILIKSCITTVF